MTFPRSLWWLFPIRATNEHRRLKRTWWCLVCLELLSVVWKEIACSHERLICLKTRSSHKSIICLLFSCVMSGCHCTSSLVPIMWYHFDDDVNWNWFQLPKANHCKWKLLSFCNSLFFLLQSGSRGRVWSRAWLIAIVGWNRDCFPFLQLSVRK